MAEGEAGLVKQRVVVGEQGIANSKGFPADVGN